MRESEDYQYSLPAQVINGLVRGIKLCLDVYILTLFGVIFKFFARMKVKKLAHRGEVLTTFHQFIIGLVITVASFQAYRCLWGFISGVLSLTNIDHTYEYKAQFVLHTFFINPSMDFVTFISILYLFYCLYLAN